MGDHRTGPVQMSIGGLLAGIIIGLNVYLLYQTFWGG
jgi:Mn2+/Fe2+ NRAMP family transporter